MTCRESVQTVGEIATCILPEGHGGKHRLLWEGDPSLIAAAAAAEEREACAKVADFRESVWSTTHPLESFQSELENVIGNAILSEWDRSDDAEPERHIASAVFRFLKTGQTQIDEIFATPTIAAAIRART